MAKKIAQLLNTQIYPYLFGLFFLLYKSASYFPGFEPVTFLLLLLAHFLFCIAIIFFVKRIPWAIQYSFSVLLLLIMLYFSAKIIDAIETNFPPLWIREQYYPLWAILFFGVSLGIENIKKIRWFIKWLTPMLNTLILIASCLSIILGLMGNHRTDDTSMRPPAKKTELLKKPGIVWLLMDEYPRSEELNKYFSFNNPLDTFLRNRNFSIINNIRSRTSATVFSINDIFNNDDTSCEKSYAAAADMLKKSQWVNELSAAGYHVQCYDFLPIGKEKQFENIYVYPLTYFEQIIHETVFFKVLYKLTNSVDSYNNHILKATESSISKIDGQPSFIWSHLLIPHGPFFRDSSGAFNKNYAVNTQRIDSLKPRFLSYLEYGNHWLMNIIDKYPSLKDDIVIISGDHSMRYLFIDKNDQTKPFCAVHMPVKYDTSALQRLSYISQLPGFIMQQLAEN